MEIPDSTLVKSREFRSLLLRMCAEFGAYPAFKVKIFSRGPPLIDSWGIIVLPRVPEGEGLAPDEKYYLLVSLGYNLIIPRTEKRRLLMRAIISKVFDLDWKSLEVSQLSGIISTLGVLAEVSNNEKLFRRFRDALSWASEALSGTRDKLSELLQKFVLAVRGYPLPDDEVSRAALSILEILRSPATFEQKVRAVSEILKYLVPKSRLPKVLENKEIATFAPALGGKGENKSWGRNPRSEKSRGKISPEELRELARKHYKMAVELAKILDKEEEKEPLNRLFKRGKLPGYSDRLRMYQKLMRYRRYIAEVRRVRLDEMLHDLSMRLTRGPGISKRGYAEWVLGDDEELLDIEASLESFGKVIPNLSTLKHIFEEDRGLGWRTAEHYEIIIDTSGSMDGEPLERAIEIGVALVRLARARDASIALITFSSGAWEGVPPSYDYDFVEDIILRLVADGGTNVRGVMGILEEHLAFVTGSPRIFFITDTAIWDIGSYGVKSKLRELAEKHPVYFIAITDELFEETRYSLSGSGVRVIYVSPEDTGAWEIVLDEYERL